MSRLALSCNVVLTKSYMSGQQTANCSPLSVCDDCPNLLKPHAFYKRQLQVGGMSHIVHTTCASTKSCSPSIHRARNIRYLRSSPHTLHNCFQESSQNFTQDLQPLVLLARESLSGRALLWAKSCCEAKRGQVQHEEFSSCHVRTFSASTGLFGPFSGTSLVGTMPCTRQGKMPHCYGFETVLSSLAWESKMEVCNRLFMIICHVLQCWKVRSWAQSKPGQEGRR